MTKKRTEPASAEARALSLLARREHSAAELRQKLVQRGIDAADADRAVARMTAEGWQSDQRYAEAMVRHRIQRGFGPRRIEAELQQAQVTESVIDSAMVGAEVDWGRQARALHARRFGAPPSSGRERDKQYRFLLGRGFEPEQVNQALQDAPED